MKTLLAVPALLLALNATAGCPVDHPRQQPVLPDGANATQAEMYQAQLEADRYLLQAETYLDCGLMNRRQYNILLGQMETFAEAYDEELIEFQIRSHMVADK